MFMELRDSYPRLSAYKNLYKDYPRVQSALCNMYAELVDCCKHLVLISNQHGVFLLARGT